MTSSPIPRAVREQVSLAGQQASLDERLTGRENLMLLGRLQRLSKRDAIARTSELLERFGITHAADRQVGTYSGGMRRRLDLAACLVVRRPVVFLDEPTTGLDPASRADMWSAIEGLVDERHRAAAHHPVPRGGRPPGRPDRRALRRPDRRRRHPAELKARVGERRVHLSLRDDEALQGAARVFERLGPELDVRARRLSVPAPEGSQDLRAVLDALEHAGVAVDEAALSRPTLDDAFFALAGEEVVR